MTEKPQIVTLEFQKELVDPRGYPAGCNFASLSRVGPDVVLEIGYFDLGELADKMQQPDEMGKPIPTRVLISHRVLLSASAVRMLHEAMELMPKEMKTKTRPE